MTKMMIAVALLFAGCCTERDIPADQACDEQAAVWCSKGGYPQGGCTRTYVQQCGPDASRMIADDAQLRCLADLDANPSADLVPRSCEITWAVVPPQCQSHCEQQ
jgi:hypothetical protein